MLQKIMKPFFEKVSVPNGQSWALFDRQLPEFSFNWHYHPEFELTLTLNSVGERFVGDHVERYGDGDLVLVGPNLPHAWRSRTNVDPQYPHRALVIWFTEDWIQGLIKRNPELAGISVLLEEAKRGVAFSPFMRELVRPKLMAFVNSSLESRWIGLLTILLSLVGDSDRQLLALQSFIATDKAKDRARLDRVLTYLHAHYTDPIRLEVVAALAAMSESQLQRFFKKCTQMTVSDYLTQLRIGRACSLLLDSDRPIALIAEEAGYSYPSYFARQFRAAKGMTPIEFRRRFIDSLK